MEHRISLVHEVATTASDSQEEITLSENMEPMDYVYEVDGKIVVEGLQNIKYDDPDADTANEGLEALKPSTSNISHTQGINESQDDYLTVMAAVQGFLDTEGDHPLPEPDKGEIPPAKNKALELHEFESGTTS